MSAKQNKNETILVEYFGDLKKTSTKELIKILSYLNNVIVTRLVLL